MEIIELANRIKKLSANDRMYLLREILNDESISVTELLVSKVADLEDFKKKAKNDIVMVATAGIELGEKEMRDVTKIKGYTRKKDDSFKLAMVKCLIEAGAYRGTEYGDEIADADFGSVDQDWYESSWRPLTFKGKEK